MESTTTNNRKHYKDKKSYKISSSSVRLQSSNNSYDPTTYSKNFDQGMGWEEPDNLSRSFSARFADPSRIFPKSTIVLLDWCFCHNKAVSLCKWIWSFFFLFFLNFKDSPFEKSCHGFHCFFLFNFIRKPIQVFWWFWLVYICLNVFWINNVDNDYSRDGSCSYFRVKINRLFSCIPSFPLFFWNN